jgi:hypothetical protein
MPKASEIRTYQGISPDTCFEVATQAFTNAGFSIFKIREIAWLVLAHLSNEKGLIEASIGAMPPASCAKVTLSMRSSYLSEDELRSLTQKVYIEFEKLLN